MNKLATLITAAVGLAAATSAQAACLGVCGTSGADGVVTLSPLGNSSYRYVTTAGGVSGAGSLGVGGETNGSLFTTATFLAAAGDALVFYFNYVTSDGSGFADYGFSELTGPSGGVLFTARTTPLGDTVPGFGLPGLAPGVTLSPASTPIIPGGPVWGPLGGSSGSCYGPGCGYTGWIKSTYTIGTAGNYTLSFGVTNYSDQQLNSGLAFDGITVGGVPVSGTPEPESWALMIVGFGLVGASSRRRTAVVAA